MAEPYIPQPVPSTGNEDLERFLAEELDRIKATFGYGGSGDPTLFVEEVYGALAITAERSSGPQAAPYTIGTTDDKIIDYDTERPVSGPLGCELDLTNGEITGFEEGTYYLSVVLTAEIQSGRAYTLTLYSDGAPTTIAGAVDSSNQSGVVQLVVAALEDMFPGTVLSLFAKADTASSQFDIQRLEFSIFRVSEER